MVAAGRGKLDLPILLSQGYCQRTDNDLSIAAASRSLRIRTGRLASGGGTWCTLGYHVAMTSAARSFTLDRSLGAAVRMVFPGALAAFRNCRWFVLAVELQLLASATIGAIAKTPTLAGPLDAYTTILGAVGVFGAVALAGELFRRRLNAPATLRPIAAYSEAWLGLREDALTPEYLATLIIIFGLAPLALSAFSAAKQAIPSVAPFEWDARLVAWGSAIDGGRPLWQRLQPTLGRPWMTITLDVFYHRVWTTLLLAAFVWAGVSPRSEARQRFLVSYVLVFLVVGNLLALMLSSAGPPYLKYIAPAAGHQYADLFAYLSRVDARSPLLSWRGEHALWNAYTRHLGGLGFGVSAMPSVHVASGTLVALFGFTVSRVVGVGLSLVALLTFVASVVLGWHYALDGLVGAIAALGIWWMAGRLVRIQRAEPR